MNKHVKKIKLLEKRLKRDSEIQSENPLVLYTTIELFYYYMDQKHPNLRDFDIYNKAHINAKLFSKMRNPKYHPSRKTLIALGLALELNQDEFELFLSSANYSFSLNNTFDIAILYCINHNIYDLFEVNEILYELEI